MIEIPDTDTPGIHHLDAGPLTWAQKFAYPPPIDEGYEAMRAASLALLGKPADTPHGVEFYPELCGMARAYTESLLGIIARLSERAREDRDTIAALRAELAGAKQAAL